MPIEQKDIAAQIVDVDKIEATENKLLEVLNEAKLNLRELISLVGSVLISIGGSLEGDGEVDFSKAHEKYFTSPTLGNAFVVLGIDMIADWATPKGGSNDGDQVRGSEETPTVCDL